MLEGTFRIFKISHFCSADAGYAEEEMIYDRKSQKASISFTTGIAAHFRSGYLGQMDVALRKRKWTQRLFSAGNSVSILICLKLRAYSPRICGCRLCVHITALAWDLQIINIKATLDMW
ncbi:hypothetical protein AVEN_104520-1 [Araneus ventricosus]|uniref:Uncharacterized protein n=1 Tax=Araneus ventricosus TaxID=182803 RepID=A0A4Y2SIG1_ARAVE|nr:hypothetical protein AVEN_104520-1 [Araneus ventricosus]